MRLLTSTSASSQGTLCTICPFRSIVKLRSSSLLFCFRFLVLLLFIPFLFHLPLDPRVLVELDILTLFFPV